MPRPLRKIKPVKMPKLGETDSQKLLIEVPRDAIERAGNHDWADLIVTAKKEGWRVQDTPNFSWCRPGHALLREGRDEMRGIPVVHYQNW